MSDVGTTRRTKLSATKLLAIWERERGKCMVCEASLQVGKFIYEHVRPLGLGGEDHPSNIRLTCLSCANAKTRNEDMPRINKAKAQKKRALGIKAATKPIKSQGFAKSEKRKGFVDPFPNLPRRRLGVEA